MGTAVAIVAGAVNLHRHRRANNVRRTRYVSVNKNACRSKPHRVRGLTLEYVNWCHQTAGMCMSYHILIYIKLKYSFVI
jgi:hypothetical protein